MKLAKNFVLKPSNEERIILNSLCFASSKLWNIANYERHNYKKESGLPYPNWYEQKKKLKSNFWFKNLPSQTAQETLKILDKSWKSFFKLKESKGIKNPKPPKYKHNEFNIKFLNNGFKLTGNELRLSIPKQQREYLSTTYNIKSKYLFVKIPKFLQLNEEVKQIEFKPLLDNSYKVTIIIEKEDYPQLKKDNGKYLSIDTGEANFLTCFDNNNGNSFIVSGKQWLSISRYFNKKIAYYQGISYGEQAKLQPNIKHYKTTKRIKNLYDKKRKQLHHWLHCTTKFIVDYCIENDISKVVIGDITGIREKANHGKKNNQKLHSLPYEKAKQQLEYKLKLQGIELLQETEEYTSQCSPNSKEVSKQYGKKSNRKYRGLYIDENEIYNADSVGAYNILRKHYKKDFENSGLSNPKRYSWDNFKYVS